MKAGGVTYKCFKCETLVPYEKVKAMPNLKCPNCGFKVLVKVRPPVVKRVKAI